MPGGVVLSETRKIAFICANQKTGVFSLADAVPSR